MKDKIRRPTPSDVEFMAENARQADKDEAFLFAGKTLKECLDATPDIYQNSYVWEVEGKVICIYGVTPTQEKEGIIWFLATDEFEGYRVLFKRRCRKAFAVLVNGYDYLYNYIYIGHIKALNWVKWLGFTVFPPEPVGIVGDMFCKFEVRKNV